MKNKKKYVYRKFAGKKYPEHRLVWIEAHGPIKPGLEIHHINGDHKDNRLENLQLLTKTEHLKAHGCNVVFKIGRKEFKHCRDCATEKEIAEFKVHQGYPYYICKKCQYKRERKRAS